MSSSSSPRGEGSTEVVLVRHGETSLNAFGIIQGQMDPELNEVGRQQALMVARRLSGEAKPAAVYSSDLRRAAETAQMISTACGVSNPVLDGALRDRHMGDLQGLQVNDFAAGQPTLFEALKSYKRKQEIPGGGETLDQLSQRCVSYLNTVVEKHKGERVIVVSHGAVIEEICIHADPTSSVREKIDNTSISIIHISCDSLHWILDKFGDVGHLNVDGLQQNASGADVASA
ncbi:hypothetical protein ACP70R_022482 [Stipagrostis hirtigluma subsp. patula]